MKVKCIDNIGWQDELTIGEIYTVIRKLDGDGPVAKYSGVRYRLKGVREFPFIERFKVITYCPCNINNCIKHRE